MKCLYCDCIESKVVDSRSADDDRTIRRRRECTACGRRFTTYETIEVTPVLVVKITVRVNLSMRKKSVTA